jgi:hypothetical protein
MRATELHLRWYEVTTSLSLHSWDIRASTIHTIISFHILKKHNTHNYIIPYSNSFISSAGSLHHMLWSHNWTESLQRTWKDLNR